MYTETDSVVLPPDTEGQEGVSVPFYVDPPNRPGLHRDIFRAHAQKMLGGLLTSTACKFCLTPALQSRLHATWREPFNLVIEEAAKAEAAKAATEAAADAAEAAAKGLYMVEAILEERPCKIKRRKKGDVANSEAPMEMEYLVRWVGYTNATWEAERYLRKLTVLTAWKESSSSRAQGSTPSSSS